MASISCGPQSASFSASCAASVASAGACRAKTGLQRVGRQIENFHKRFERQVSRINAVVAAENFFQDGAGTRLEPGKLRGVLQRVPTVALGETLRRGGGSKSDNEHE